MGANNNQNYFSSAHATKNMSRRISNFFGKQKDAFAVFAISYCYCATGAAFVVGAKEARKSKERGLAWYHDMPKIIFRSYFFPFYIREYL